MKSRHLRTLSFLLFLAILFTTCKDGKKVNYKPTSIGAVNSLAVVMDNELWKGKVGDKVREHFAATVVGLTWEEPLFSINHMPTQVFQDRSRNTRNILYVQKDSVDVAHIKTDMYALPQKVGVIKGRTEEEIIENVESKADEFINAFKNLELTVTQKNFLKSLNKETVLQEKFGISLNLPSIYRIDVQKDNFVWIERQIQKGTASIIAYEMAGDYFKNDSTLVKDIVRMRDSIGATYVPGPDVPNKTTHMRTEPAFSPSVFPTEIDGKEAIEVKGIWDIKNYPMAGPFLTYIIKDKENDRILVLEGFVFAPATNKRDDIFQLEAIMKTVRFSATKRQQFN
ncbi:DUF4837 family protein [Maribacter halichondriae]|uniref:DUF4837 family protein n=1 Tax=Maribacter halichondriae TaxID=2980554 RepID=UPI00235894C5|nr:DUF4837 family protein [Maribacter sp. Hal144]